MQNNVAKQKVYQRYATPNCLRNDDPRSVVLSQQILTCQQDGSPGSERQHSDESVDHDISKRMQRELLRLADAARKG
eukprot:948974-Prymnesium_polylepis.2